MTRSRPRRSSRLLLTTAGLLVLAAVLAPVLFLALHRAQTAQAAPSALKNSTAPVSSSSDGGSGLLLLHDDLGFAAQVSPPTLTPPAIEATAGIVVDVDSGAILWQRNPHTPLAPASTTKIMTALVTLENFRDTRRIQVTADALTQAADETRVGLLAGETLTVHELLLAMMLRSANDAAMTLAVDTVGMPKFVAAMNAQAEALGLHDSHYVQPVGLDDPGQKSSAYDLAVMAADTYDNFPLFRQIVGTSATTLPASADHQLYQLYNINLLLQTYPGSVGIKPGYTGDAGYCLVGMAERDGHRLISVLLNSPYVYHQSALLLDWGFRTEGLPSELPSPTPTAPAHR